MIKVTILIKGDDGAPLKLCWERGWQCDVIAVLANDKVRLAPRIKIKELEKAMGILEYCKVNVQ